MAEFVEDGKKRPSKDEATDIGKVAAHAALSTAMAASMSAALSEPPDASVMDLPEPVPIVRTLEEMDPEPEVQAPLVEDQEEIAARRREQLLKFLRYALIVVALLATVVFGAMKGCASCTAKTLMAPPPDQGSAQQTAAQTS